MPITDRDLRAHYGRKPGAPPKREPAPMRSGTQPTRYHIEMMVQSDWRRTTHSSFENREYAKSQFSKMLEDHPTWWLRLVSETVLETVTP